MKVRICDIRPNPFRNVDRYPYNPEKIEQLRESLRTTGFWGNITARTVEYESAVEIAYGHHRLEAMRLEYGPEHEIDVVIRDLSDDEMLKIMARENMTEWGTSAAVEMETIRAIVEAYGAGRIDMSLPADATVLNKLRFAPSFLVAEDQTATGDHPYTVQMVAEYAGWLNQAGEARQKTYDVLAALELIEEGILSETDYHGLSTSQAQAVTQQAKVRRDEARAQARQSEQEARLAEMAAHQAEEQREAARKQREAERVAEAEAQVRHDEEMRAAAERRAREAQAAYERAQTEQQRFAERAQASRERAQQTRQSGHQSAAAAGRHVGSQIRSGASVREATRSAQQAQAPAAHAQYPFDAPARRAAGVLTRLFSDSDIRRLLDQIDAQPGSISEEALSELLSALEQLGEDAGKWGEQLKSQKLAALVSAL